MVDDFHSHHFPAALAVRAMAGMCRKTEGTLWPAGDGTLATQLDNLELAGVDKAVACPIATKPHLFEGILRGAVALRDGAFGERARDRIIPFASIHPHDPEAARHLEQVAAAGIKGVKFHSYYQDFSLADPSVRPVFAKIADLGLVAICHCGGDVCWKGVRGYCGPDEIAALLKSVPGLKFVAAHLGGCWGYPPHATDVLLDTGCFVDTSIIHSCWHQDEPMRILRSWPRDRILFGTDFPWTHYPEAVRWVKSVRDPDDWELLFGGNACRLLGLKS